MILNIMTSLRHVASSIDLLIWGVPKIRGIFFGGPQIRTIAHWDLDRGSPFEGNYHIARASR